MTQKSLHEIVSEYPFPDYASWWPMGSEFLNFISEAIVSQWSDLPGNDERLARVRGYVAEYIELVYGREARPALVEAFIHKKFDLPLYSGEFDALSYAFFRSAFKLIERHASAFSAPPAQEKRHFTQRVGQIFFAQLHEQLKLELPDHLDDEEAFARLKTAIARVGDFLRNQGYLREHFAFYFEVTTEYGGHRIIQTESDFLNNLQGQERAYALYEMGYPAILPSAVYLYHTLGEAQHHSSRIIEELFARLGYEAHETDDFDPTGFPSNRVVELWEIRRA